MIIMENTFLSTFFDTTLSEITVAKRSSSIHKELKESFAWMTNHAGQDLNFCGFYSSSLEPSPLKYYLL